MNLFIDTNVFLSFYHFTKDDLEELKKLSVLLEQGELTLFVPRQVLDEFSRNRQIKIADALKQLKDQRLNLQFPQICKDFEEYDHLRKLQKEYQEHHSTLIRQITEQVWQEKLKADETVRNLIKKAKVVENEDKAIADARLRMDVGNPPGKKGSLGDAINWELLLKHVPDEADLYFVSDDKDYFSPLDENEFNYFLLREWEKRKKSELVCYRRLSSFLKDHFPKITLASEFEKELYIQKLAASGNFSQTHSLVARLRRYGEFTATQINDIVEAVISNTQIFWILDDRDVNTFIRSVIEGNEGQINESNLDKLKQKLEAIESKEEDFDDELEPF